jgi:23S rRNA (uracil-5-)-methyltransferase RumA
MVEPLCPYFKECGGCSLQHIDYELQLSNKKEMIKNLLNIDEIDVYSASPYYYRNRMDFIFHKKGLGLRKKNNWSDIIDIEKCYIASRPLNLLLSEIRDFFKEIDSYSIHKKNGTFKYAVLRTPGYDSSISFVLNEDSMHLEKAGELIKKFADNSIAKNIIVTYSDGKDSSVSDEYYVVKGLDYLEDYYHERKFLFSVQGFFQNNREIAEYMHLHVYRLLEKYKDKNMHLLDLYGGVGTFGIMNSVHFSSVLIVESVESAINYAKKNIKENNILNADAIVKDAKYLRQIKLEKDLVVITDPPRSGMHPNTINRLNEILPKSIIYISCNPEQMKRDIMKFKSNYDIGKCALFDMFPQTNHCEVIVELIKK